MQSTVRNFEVLSGIDRCFRQSYAAPASWLDAGASTAMMDGEWVNWNTDGTGILARPATENSYMSTPTFPVWMQLGDVTAAALGKITIIMGGAFLCRTKLIEGTTFTPNEALLVYRPHDIDTYAGHGVLAPKGQNSGYVVGYVAEKGYTGGWLYFHMVQA